MPVPSPAEEPAPIRRLLTDDVFDRLKDDIVHGRLAPGQRLHDLTLAHELGMSRSTVRTALLRLEEVGLVEAVPNLFTRVAPIDLDHFTDTNDTARALYLFAARMGTPFLDDDQIAEMTAWAYGRPATLGAVPEEVFSGRAAAAFFRIFVAALDNAPLERTLDRLAPHLRRVVGLYAHLLPIVEVEAGLRAVVDAAARRDADAVTETLTAYFDGPLEVFRERLREALRCEADATQSDTDATQSDTDATQSEAYATQSEADEGTRPRS